MPLSKLIRKLPQFKGLMAPTFTPFNEKNLVNYDVIEPYAKLLKSKGIPAVLINGTSGEGMSLTVDERKKVTSEWSRVCKKFDILLMVQIAGCAFVDTVELAKHAASLNVDGVLCLPELYFKPKSIEKLVDYLSDLSLYCPDIPLYYYHIPKFTEVDLPMANFMKLARSRIPSFSGIKFSSGDLEQALPCLKHGQVFLGPNTILAGAITLGFTNAIMTSLNVKPKISFKILEFLEEGKIVEAREQQMMLNDYLEETMKKGKNKLEQIYSNLKPCFVGNGDWVQSLKKEFNDQFKDVPLGSTRKPL